MTNTTTLTVIRSADFNGTLCDFYQDNSNREMLYLTREQIGRALEYKDPQNAIDVIHNRHKDRLDQFSVTVKLSATDGKLYDTTVYTYKGAYEICRFSRQSNADAFFDFVWDVIEAIRTGKATLQPFQQTGNEWVFELNGVAVADSRMVASVFGKMHKYVLRDIQNIINDMYPLFDEGLIDNQSAQNCADYTDNQSPRFYGDYATAEIAKLFIEGTYTDGRNHPQKLYYLPRQGFMLLVMGFTGQKALMWKLQFIKRYDAMEAALSTVATSGDEYRLQRLEDKVDALLAASTQPGLPAPAVVNDPRITAILCGMPELLTPADVRQVIGKSMTTTLERMKQPDFPAMISEGRYFVLKTAFIAWLNQTPNYQL